ncbi:phosphate acetyltransferase [Candidatus Woesearchaeota archaeon]|nr:phosphate acetyltransferase [Candidatus Woesearchaeota archaeon]
MDILKEVYKKAVRKKAKIVFVEGEDKRVKEAIKIINKKKLCLPIVLVKGSLEERLNEGVSLLKENKADGLIAGCLLGTAKVARAAFTFKKGLVSGNMLMLKGKGSALHEPDSNLHEPGTNPQKNKYFIFADASVIPEPNEEQLAVIAKNANELALNLNIKPRIAFLSFSTNKSSEHTSVEKVRKAVEIAKKNKLNCDGEMQVDAALISWIGKVKFPKSEIAGNANVLIFPDLNSGNISYKLVERLGGYRAIGPILSNLEKPVNVLSKGCNSQDIVDLAAITGVEC